MQVLIPDGIFANSFGSPTRPHWEPGVALALCMAFNKCCRSAESTARHLHRHGPGATGP